MNDSTPTRPRDREALLKAALRRGAGIYDLSASQLADMADEENDTVEQWLSPHSRVNVPARLLAAPRLHRGLRAFLFSELDRLAGEALTLGADTAEAQNAVALRACGQFVIVSSPVVTVERIGTELAQQLLVTGERASAAFNAMCVRMRRRVVTGGYPRA